MVMSRAALLTLFFFFNDTATTEIYTLSLHDALPICLLASPLPRVLSATLPLADFASARSRATSRSEEHTSELQSRSDLVCRLLLEKKKNLTVTYFTHQTALCSGAVDMSRMVTITITL